MSLLAGIISGAQAPVTQLSNIVAYGNGSWINGTPSVSSNNLTGDLLISVQMVRGTPVSVNTPSGFTKFIQTNGSYYSINASYKIATADNESVGFANNNETSAVVIRVRPNGIINTVTPNISGVDETTSGSINDTISLSTATYPVVAVSLGFNSANTRNVSTNPNLTNGIYFDSSANQNLLLYNFYNTSPGDINSFVLVDGTTFLASFYLSVA